MDFILAGIWMSLAWSLRGQFGHLHGALIPGAFAALMMVLSPGREKWRAAFPSAVVLSSLGFSLGGHLSYGKTIELIIHTPDFLEAVSGLGDIFILGAVWGGLGATLLGFGFSEKPMIRKDIFFLSTLFLFWFVLLGVFNLEQYDLAAFGAGLVLLQAYNFFFKQSRIIGGFGLAGFLGFGLGFLIAVTILWAGEQGIWGRTWPWWSLRDQILGFVGGCFLYEAALRFFKEGLEPAGTTPDSAKRFGFLWLMVFIPAINGRDVLAYWAGSHHFPALGLYFVAGHLIFFLVILAAGILKIKAAELTGPRVLCFCGIFMAWFLSFWAIVKETAVLGPARWESAYTLFLLFSGMITFRSLRVRHA